MDGDSSVFVSLDNEFDRYLSEMKPHVLKLSNRIEKQRCGLWIKKLCEPPLTGTSGRKNRNAYTELLLHMLKRGCIEGPFVSKPDSGPLSPLPPYMSIYFDDRRMDVNRETIPDWVADLGNRSSGADESTDADLDVLMRPTSYTERPTSYTDRPTSYTADRPTSYTDRPADLSPYLRRHAHSASGRASSDREQRSPSPQRPSRQREERMKENVVGGSSRRPNVSYNISSDDDEDSHSRSRPCRVARTGSLKRSTGSHSKVNPFPASVKSFRDETSLVRIHEKELEMKTKMLEVKFHEEKLKLQQQHDHAVQKILERKNQEIEDVKKHYRAKVKESDEHCNKLDKKVQGLMTDNASVRESRDKRIAEISKTMEETGLANHQEFDAKLHTALNQFEDEKFEIQKEHTRNIQELLDDTNSRLQKMEDDTTFQTAEMNAIIKDLESRVQILTDEAEKTSRMKCLLDTERMDLQNKCEKLTSDYQDTQIRYDTLECTHTNAVECHLRDSKSMKNMYESTIEFLKQEHELADAKSSDSISVLEQHVHQLKKSLDDTESQRLRQTRELEQVQQQDKMHQEHLHEKKVQSLQKEQDHNEQAAHRQIRKLENLISDKDDVIKRLTDEKTSQQQQSELAIEEFKNQIERQSNRVYEDMKHQMEVVETDLNKSKISREKQAKDFIQELEETKAKYQKEISEMRGRYEQERSESLHNHKVESEMIKGDHDQEVDYLKDNFSRTQQELEQKLQQRVERDSKIIAELEHQIKSLQEEVVNSNHLRKQQLVELGLLREEEKQRLEREHENSVTKLRAQMDQQRLDLQKQHSFEMEKTLEKTNGRLKEIEDEYSTRIQKSQETIAETRRTLETTKTEQKRERDASERKLLECISRLEEEKRLTRRQHQTTLQDLQQQLVSQQNKLRDGELKQQQEEIEYDEKILELRSHYEQQIRGLMPANVQQELEDTITSLKSQIHSLQQRALVLQEEQDKQYLQSSVEFTIPGYSSPIKGCS